ncbi:NifB/NifX family molybdenum-iron cluster-binding protein [Candidatus Bathyarchaeota archaeon]|nr:NifB/NifX family molybdenum-iron cluster-binding protein [Candidatus Bathyarchaeota archaeon]
MRIAVPTKGDKGIEDVVSDVFGRSGTFTIIDVSNGLIRDVKVVKNPAASYKYGAGPIVVKMLADMGVALLCLLN